MSDSYRALRFLDLSAIAAMIARTTHARWAMFDETVDLLLTDMRLPHGGSCVNADPRWRRAVPAGRHS
jgi:hypothetical protein